MSRHSFSEGGFPLFAFQSVCQRSSDDPRRPPAAGPFRHGQCQRRPRTSLTMPCLSTRGLKFPGPSQRRHFCRRPWSRARACPNQLRIKADIGLLQPLQHWLKFNQPSYCRIFHDMAAHRIGGCPPLTGCLIGHFHHDVHDCQIMAPARQSWRLAFGWARPNARLPTKSEEGRSSGGSALNGVWFEDWKRVAAAEILAGKGCFWRYR